MLGLIYRSLAEIFLICAEVNPAEVEAVVKSPHIFDNLGVSFVGGAHYKLRGLFDSFVFIAPAGKSADELNRFNDIFDEAFLVG